MTIRTASMLAACLVLAAGTAYAQQQGGGPGTPNLVGSENSPDLRGPDDRGKALDDARNEAVRGGAAARARPGRAVPAKPSDLTPGAEVRDTKGVVIGTVGMVGASGAVVESSGGKVEVPLESFGKNSQGLLLPLTKDQFDAIVAQATQPAH